MGVQSELLEQISNVGSRLKKEELLKTANKDTRKFLTLVLDPMITFGVTVEDPEIKKTSVAHADVRNAYWEMFFLVAEDLQNRHLTGNAAKSKLKDLLELWCPTELDLKWSIRALNKDLDAGFQVSTLNRVFPGSIDEFEVALAKPYEPDKHTLEGAWCVEPKLDGLRMVVIDGVAFTRNGRTIDSVGHILKELEDADLRKMVFDGEVMGETEFNEDSGKIRKKGMGPNLSLTYNVFDVIERKQWAGKNTDPLCTRKSVLSTIFKKNKFKHIKLVPWADLPSDPDTKIIFEMKDDFIKDGKEGAMLKNLNAPYIFKRSDDLLKLKDFQDADGRIVDTFEGKGRLKGKLGGVIAEFDGVLTRVGSGFNDEQRVELWKNRSSLIDRVVEVKYQNKTPEGSLRFPVFIKFRKDKQ